MTGSSPIRRIVRRFVRPVVAPTGDRRAPKTPASRPAGDRFAAFRDPAGPTLVAGPTPRHDAALDERPSIVVLVPHLDVGRMSGGPNTIFHVAMPLARDGSSLRFVATGGPLDADVARLRGHVE